MRTSYISKLAILTLGLTGCGLDFSGGDPPLAPALDAAHIEGLPVDGNAVRAIAAAVQDRLDTRLDNRYTVTFVRDLLACDAPSKLCSGLTDFAGFSMTVSLLDDRSGALTDCLGDTALAHELAHALVGDPKHARPEVWGPGGVVDGMRHFGCK